MQAHSQGEEDVGGLTPCQTEIITICPMPFLMLRFELEA